MIPESPMDIQRFDRILRIRVLASTVAFAVFIGVALHGVLTGWHYDNPTPAVALLLLAFFSWPRRARPKGWKPDPENTRELQEDRGRSILQWRLQKVQLVYFFAALFLLALLPHFLGEPIFSGF